MKQLITCSQRKEEHNCHNCDFTYPLDSDGMCILHSSNKEKDKDAFNEAIQKEIKNKQFINFTSVCFPNKVSFTKMKFEQRIMFSQAIFLDEVEFRNVEFLDSVDFYQTKFLEAADFLDCKFASRASFRKVDFDKKADFSGSKFLGNVDFRNTKITIPGFYKTIFSDEVDFSSVEFTEKAYFYRTEFHGRTLFDESNFYQKAYFNDAIFKGATSFFKTNFYNTAYFSHAKFLGKTFFDSINSAPDASNKSFVANFTNIETDQKLLQYRNISLANVLFIGSNLRLIKFHNVKWAKYWGRDIICEEAILAMRRNAMISCNIGRTAFLAETSPFGEDIKPNKPSQEEYALVEELYRFLKLNYEEEGDLKRSSDFHYGEMEMQRRASKWRWFPFYWHNIFRLLNGYGERPSWAMGWLAVFLVGLAGLVWGLGLEVGNPPRIAGFGDSFIYLLQKATLQRPTWADPIGFWGKLMAGLSVLFIPGQAALFLLALRNRLGRRR